MSLLPVYLGNALCMAAMVAFVPVIGPIIRSLGLEDWHTGLIVGITGIFWIASAPSWGRLSDKVGRRKVLLIATLGFFISYIALTLFIDSSLEQETQRLWVVLTVLVLIRACVGSLYSAIPVVCAASITDSFRGSERTQALSKMGAFSAIGLVLGPLLGASLSQFGLTVPLYIAAILPLLALCLFFSLPNRKVLNSNKSPALPLFGKATRPAAITAFVAMCAVMTGQLCVGFFAMDRIDLDAKGGAAAAGAAMTAIGVILAVVQGAIVPKLKLSADKMAAIGAAFSGLGFMSIFVVDSVVLLISSYVFMAAGMGLVFPSMQVLAANAVSQEQQGAAAGIVSAAQGLAMVVMPFGATALYEVTPELPYVITALMLFILAVYLFKQQLTQQENRLCNN